MKGTFIHGRVIAVIAAGLLFTTLFAPAAGGYEIVGWGDDSHGQATPPDGNFIAISAGWTHSIGLKSDGSIVCWGQNDQGQSTPPAGNDFTAIAAGSYHSLALKSDGSLVGWGYNGDGQATPPDGNDFIAVSAGTDYGLALKSDGSIVGWGWNVYGQATPPAGNDFNAIAAGANYGLALKSDGSLAGWGNNGYGQSTSPAGNDFIAIATGGSRGHNLAIKSDGSIIGWGYNDYDECNVPAGNNFIAVAASLYHSLALKSDGTIAGWGYNNHGQATPPDGNDFVAISAGAGHSLALRKAAYDISPSTILITKCTVTAGSKENSDKISFSGTMDANSDDFNDADTIEVTFYSDDIVDLGVLDFPIDASTFKNGKYSYSGIDDGIKKSFTYDIKTGKFTFAAANADLAGLGCPVSVEIEIGNYIGAAEVNEMVVNGTKPIPLQLMMGVKNVLRVDKCTVKRNDKKLSGDQFTVKGAFAVEDTDVDMVSEEFVVTLDSQTFTLPADSFKAGKGKFTCTKVHAMEDGSIAAATFNFNSCAFTLTIKNTNIDAISGDVDFGVAFADFDEAEQVTIP